MLIFKKGSTFSFGTQLRNLQGVLDLSEYTLKCQLRQVNADKLVQDLTATILDATQGLISLYATAAQTANWPVMDCFFDIEVTDTSTGEVAYTFTHKIKVIKRITQ